MVLERRVGKKRGFLRGFLLTVVTLGVYGIYWNYKAHKEVFQQFEMESRGHDDGVLFLVLGLVIPPLIWVYQYKFVENIETVRQEMGLPEGVSAVEFLLWLTLGAFILVGPLVGYYKLQSSINTVWAELETGSGAEGFEATTPEKATA